MKALRVLVYEDNAMLRESLASLLGLKDDVQFLDAYENVLSVVGSGASHEPDVVLMDIDMPGMTGIEAVKKIRSFNNDVAILMLTVFDDNRHVFDAICAGASGYLLKKHISSRLFDAIDEVLSGGAPMSPSIARMVISAMKKTDNQNKNPYALTRREQEMLRSLANGNSYKLMAAELQVSIDTVRTISKKYTKSFTSILRRKPFPKP